MMLKTALIGLFNLLQIRLVLANKCGTALYEDCIGEGDPRYDPDVSADLKDIHPIFSKYEGFWLCNIKDYDGDTQPKLTKYVPLDEEARRSHPNRPYNLTNVPAFVNVTVDGTRLYFHELRIYSPAPLEWCAGTPDDGRHTNVMDGGECGVNGWAEGGDVVRTSTHNKDEYSITAKSTGIFSSGEAESHGGHDDHLRRMLLRSLEDGDASHTGHGGGGGVEHPLHGVDNVLFAADSSSGDALHYAIKTFSEDFDSFAMRSGSFDLTDSSELGTSQYNCDRVSSQEKFESEISITYDKAQVTVDTREQLNIKDHGCLVPPCATEEEICGTDPNCSESPFEEKETMKPAAIAGFCMLGAAVAFGLVIFYYQRRIHKLNKSAKSKFAGTMRQSFRGLSNEANDHNKQRHEVINAFDSIDADGSGFIPKDELWEFISSNEDHNMTKQEFDTLFKKIDRDGSGEIDFAEFVSFMTTMNDGKSGVQA